MKKILLVSSSSGGHIYPCVNLGEELKKRGHLITYLGIKNKMEESIYPSGIFLDLPSSFNNFLTFKERKKYLQERNKLKEIIHNHDIIICFGGFITFITALVNFFHRPLYTHEQNVILGDSLKYSYLFTKKIFTSFNTIKKRKVIYTSNPNIIKIKRRTDINYLFPKVMFIFGSLSSSSCLKEVEKFLLTTKLKNQFLLVTGEKYYPTYKYLARDNILVKKKIDINEELLSYDLVFTRGGASTLIELLKANVEIVSIPSPYVKNNHQLKNVMYLKDYINIILEKDFSPLTIEEHILSMKKKNTYSIDINPIEKIIAEVEND